MVNCGSTTEPACLPKDQLKTDPLHCGNCDRTCADNEFCKDGKCTVSSCTGNECFFNNACINQNEHCGTQCLNCNTANLASASRNVRHHSLYHRISPRQWRVSNRQCHGLSQWKCVRNGQLQYAGCIYKNRHLRGCKMPSYCMPTQCPSQRRQMY